MVTSVHELAANRGGTASSVFDDSPPLTGAAALGSRGERELALPASLLAVPAAVGALYARAPTRRRGLLEACLAALGLDALWVDLARWLTSESAFDSHGQVGDLALRHHDARIEACARVDDLALEAAIDHGYRRLAGYLCGENQTGELIARTTPILTAMRDGCYTVSFVMPPGCTLDGLPRPDHPGIELRKLPATEIAALPFRGRCTRDNIAAHQGVLLQRLADAGLSPRGSIAYASFGSLAGLPVLRRDELWIEVG